MQIYFAIGRWKHKCRRTERKFSLSPSQIRICQKKHRLLVLWFLLQRVSCKNVLLLALGSSYTSLLWPLQPQEHRSSTHFSLLKSALSTFLGPKKMHKTGQPHSFLHYLSIRLFDLSAGVSRNGRINYRFIEQAKQTSKQSLSRTS